MKSCTLALPDAAATERAGAALARVLAPGMVVTLAGDLGAGKTTLARGVLRALGWRGPVKSPTYTLVEHYPLSNLYFYHFDFYRFDDVAEWDDAGVASTSATMRSVSSSGRSEWPAACPIPMSRSRSHTRVRARRAAR